MSYKDAILVLTHMYAAMMDNINTIPKPINILVSGATASNVFVVEVAVRATVASCCSEAERNKEKGTVLTLDDTTNDVLLVG